MVGYLATPEYQKQCLSRPVVPSIMMGGVFSGISVLQGAPLTPQLLAMNCGFLYIYHTMQCPMEAIQGRQSLIHNVIAGGTLGAFGVQGGHLGIPFVNPSFFYRFPSVTPAMAAFGVYGGLAGVLGGMLSGKPL
eukprot:CAMPEP_0206435698 /NCGR_PEP_ID=MMETSP0324_2-20121206/10033_1 /ASSEMBLY_ACC=CAM_ASM_000836 /TAXON_ID=2866 /ORGANISM="Crypthecodinium cohnii, Strain Seligo" /LENGTH=133 /DNA_ID=CAMNT_0053902703 /DNA_START=41 /DNA_END=442 /DNA_ORIENTATION=-